MNWTGEIYIYISTYKKGDFSSPNPPNGPFHYFISWSLQASRRDVAWLRNRVAQLDERNSQMFSEVEQWRHAEGAAVAKQPRKGRWCCVLLGVGWLHE